ncbi:uncharacterized protein LOC129600743 [Paramacrobiotus metropolitanus]|uniref:uncharacterized protein LOC129600743 n=1 Tax=Paramacrobiotus metropolitanus TaxID=2943436 RepID=UPI0024464F74|nr:uncharacterized protein LOC129600743 [Paramacrobiotus metropolitanus]
MKYIIVFAAVIGIAYATPVKRAVSAQNPPVWTALDQLSGRNKLSTADIYNLYVSARAGQDYPTYNANDIPQGNWDCSAHAPGYYADTDFKCQVVRRCDVNGNLTSHICPNMTLFNQITLVCHWFWEVDCSQAQKFYDYSNSRLYQGADVPLLDNQENYQTVNLGAQGRSDLYTLTWDVKPIAGNAKK